MKPSLTASFTIETELSARRRLGWFAWWSHTEPARKPHNRLRARPSRNLHHSVTTSAESRNGGEGRSRLSSLHAEPTEPRQAPG